MKPEQLSAEVEALDKAAKPGPWVVEGEDGCIRGADGISIFITDGYFFLNPEDAHLIARYRTLAPELARLLREAERDEARARYGKLKALHAELAADVSMLRRPDYPKMVATHKEIAHALGLDERSTADALLTAIVIMRNQARATLDMQARARHMENVASLARAELETLRAAQTPRPIAEAPKDGTWIVGLWPDVLEFTPELLRWAGLHGWERNPTDGGYHPTHFLSLPVKP